MNQSIFKYVFNRLSILSDEELAKMDFDSVKSVLNDSDISDKDHNELIKLFDSIRKELPLSHHGIKGMKWGIRRYQNKDGSLTAAGQKRYGESSAKQTLFDTASSYEIQTRDGEVITAEPVKPTSTGKKILNALFGISDKDTLGHRGDANYTLNDSKGQKIGELSLINKNKDTAYIDWITINNNQRGKGYATDIINDLLIKARDAGYSRVELNALKKPRPLYERIGFTYSNNLSIMDKIAGFEFGCKRMEYDLKKIQHSQVTGNNVLYHHGIKGMKWGVRRYQNKDGSLTAAGKKRYASGNSTERAERNKKIARFGIATATVAVAAVYVHKNPEAIGRVVSKFRGMKMSDISSKAVDKGKEYVKKAMKGAKEGVDEAIREAPKKAAKAVVTGIIMNQTKKALDLAVGKEESAKIFQANDNKKIGKFWKVSPDDRDDDD